MHPRSLAATEKREQWGDEGAIGPEFDLIDAEPPEQPPHGSTLVTEEHHIAVAQLLAVRVHRYFLTGLGIVEHDQPDITQHLLGFILRAHRNHIVAAGHQPRSEERRVGKECRSRWSSDD